MGRGHHVARSLGGALPAAPRWARLPSGVPPPVTGRGLGCRLLGQLLGDLLLQEARLARQLSRFAFLRKASRPPRCSTERNASAETRRRTFWFRASEIGDLHEVRQEAATRLVVGVAHIVAGQDRFAGQFAGAGHSFATFSSCVDQTISPRRLGSAHYRRPLGKLRFHSGNCCRRQARHRALVAARMIHINTGLFEFEV